MARRCKCQVCGNWGTTDTFYKVEKGSRNLYYCSEEEYLNWKKEDNTRIELLRYICNEIWHYDDYRMLPRVLQKQINKMSEVYNYEVILLTVQEHKDTLKYWMNLEGKFNNEYGKSSYMMAIIKNKINEVYKKWKIKQKQQQKQHKPKIDITIINGLQDDIQQEQEEKNGILEFLEEDDI